MKFKYFLRYEIKGEICLYKKVKNKKGGHDDIMVAIFYNSWHAENYCKILNKLEK